MPPENKSKSLPPEQTPGNTPEGTKTGMTEEEIAEWFREHPAHQKTVLTKKQRRDPEAVKRRKRFNETDDDE